VVGGGLVSIAGSLDIYVFLICGNASFSEKYNKALFQCVLLAAVSYSQVRYEKSDEYIRKKIAVPFHCWCFLVMGTINPNAAGNCADLLSYNPPQPLFRHGRRIYNGGAVCRYTMWAWKYISWIYIALVFVLRHNFTNCHDHLFHNDISMCSSHNYRGTNVQA
jgi:hypothetical protein